MSTTFSITLTISDKDAHHELTEITGILQNMIDRFDTNHAKYAGSDLNLGPIRNADNVTIGFWQLHSNSKTREEGT